jgi:hypothetical protein
MGRCYACCQENCGYTHCSALPDNGRLPRKTRIARKVGFGFI